MDLEYVISGVNMTGIFNPTFLNHEKFQPDFVEALGNAVDELTAKLQSECKNINPELSVLFNAYTEKKFGGHFKGYNRLNMKNVYSDSGGLQIVTAGKEVNEEIKDRIYETQLDSDIAMCFDVIPLESTSLVRTSSERTNTDNKIFDQSRHKESGRLTGLNIKKQIEYFQNKGSDTKVMIIVQGNEVDDMIQFYEEIQEQLTDDHFKSVGGIAVADTCMGNKELETVDMLTSAHKISKFAHPNACKQLHLLGVGSVSRMAPSVFLSKSGFLNNFETLSCDSSSHTIGFEFGGIKTGETGTKVGKYRNDFLERTVTDIYTMFGNTFKQYGDLDWYMNEVFFDKKGGWDHRQMVNRASESGDLNKVIGSALANFTYALYQVNFFMLNLDKVAGGEYTYGKSDLNNRSISSLSQVITEEDMYKWKAQYKRYITSARITRKEDAFGLDLLMG